jgi:hypothetical protein
MGAVRAAKAEGLQIVPTPEDSCNELNSAPVTPFTAEFWPDLTLLPTIADAGIMRFGAGTPIGPTPEDSCNELNSAPVTPFTAEFWPDSTPLLDGCIVA